MNIAGVSIYGRGDDIVYKLNNRTLSPAENLPISFFNEYFFMVSKIVVLAEIAGLILGQKCFWPL